MKRFLALTLALLVLAALPALAESAHVYAPDGLGISLTLGDWVQQTSGQLYVSHQRDSASPCAYADMIFLCPSVDAADELTCAFALCNRLVGSEYAPTPNGQALPNQQLLFAQGDRELILFYADVPDGADEATTEAFTLPVEWLLAHPEDVAISEPTPQPEAVGFDGLYGVSVADGAPVTADVLSGHRLTMINVWATYCNPCIGEMPELAKLNADYAEQGFQIIGVLSDVSSAESPDEDGRAYAQVIINQTGADYLHLIPGEGLLRGAMAEITAVPTTYFVDENGQQVGEALVGSRSYEDWAAIVDDLLSSLE